MAEPVASTVPYRPRLLYTSVFSWVFLSGGRFLAPFLEHVCQFDATQIGVALALQQAVSAALGSLAGAMADARERRRPGRGRAECFAVGIVLGTFFFVSHVFVASVAWHTLLQVGYAAAISFVFPVLDGMTLHHLESTGQDSSAFGKERLFGAISWALTAMLVAPLLDFYGFTTFYPATLVASIGLMTSLYIYVGSHDHSNRIPPNVKRRQSDIITDDDSIVVTCDEERPQSPIQSSRKSSKIPLYRLLWMVLGTPYGLAFGLAVVTLASGQAVVEGLVFLFFEWLGSSYTVMGLTVALTVAFEIPIFHVAPQLLERWGSGRLLLLAGFAYVTRVVAYSLIPQDHIYWVLLFEPLHGVTYACTVTATVDFVARLLPPGHEASGQGLVGLLRGVGSVLGVWLGGWAQTAFGPRFLYRSSAATVLLGMLVFATVSHVCAPPPQEHTVLSQTDETDNTHLELTTHTQTTKDSCSSSSSSDDCLEASDSLGFASINA